MIKYFSQVEFPSEDQKEDEGPILQKYGTDFTLLAREGKLEECFGREKELLELMEILVRRQKNNPVLIGEAGVGKTAIVELFATKMVHNLVPFVLQGRTLISLNLAKMLAGAKYRGEFEERFQKMVDEVLENPHIIIFIDEIHNITGMGATEGSFDAANLLKPILSRSGFQCIGATTIAEYQRIEKDPALNRRFQPIHVKEPTVEETTYILYGLRPTLEAYHNLEILPSALRLAADLSNRYITDRFLPDKAIDLIDRAAAREVIKVTNIVEGSVISSVVSVGLKIMAKLRIEAFRRGDIATEFVFQELENAYRNYILEWVENPLIIPEKAPQILSPISEQLFRDMSYSVLSHVDKLLFSSNDPRKETKQTSKIKNLSSVKNKEIFKTFEKDLTAIQLERYNGEYFEDNNETNEKYADSVSSYRICLYLLTLWLKQNKFYDEKTTKKEQIEDKLTLVQICKNYSFDKYIRCLFLVNANLDVNSNISEADFLKEDTENYEETYEILSQLESTRIEIVKNFLQNLRPVLKKGLVKSLSKGSNIDLSEKDLSLVYSLLGYFSTNTGREFLSNLGDPALLAHARKIGNFSRLKGEVKQSHIRDLLTSITGIPVTNISKTESAKLANLEISLHKRVIGQEEAIGVIAKAIRRARLGIQNPNRPLASFFFCGPTGVGKTEVTKALAVSLFGSETDMIRFDMSEFMEKFAVSRLVGAPPGYVGYDEGGQLTEAVRRKPYSVVLLDEIEKAHPDLLNILLQILEDGRLTDNRQRLIPFGNTVIIMTSNAAAEEIQEIIRKESANDFQMPTQKDTQIDNFLTYEDEYAGVINFLKSPITENFMADIQKEIKGSIIKTIRTVKDPRVLDKESKEISKKIGTLETRLKSAVLDKLSKMFLPEFLNRLDDIIVFQPLRLEELRKICEIMISTTIKRVQEKNILLIVSEKVKHKLTRESYNPLFGARPLRRLVTKHIEDLLSETLLNAGTASNITINIDLTDGNEVIATVSKPNKKALTLSM